MLFTDQLEVSLEHRKDPAKLRPRLGGIKVSQNHTLLDSFKNFMCQTNFNAIETAVMRR